MSLLSFIYNIFFYPFELIYEFLYALVMRFIHVPGIAIIILSVFINTMLIPVNKGIEKLCKVQRLKEEKMSFWVDHIKKNFKGDERFFMLRTYYRQNEYRPIHSLKTAFPLLVQFPVFIAAYNFLSSLSQLKGISFLFLKDLGKPDALLSICGFSINILPIVMTIVSLLSGYVYTKKTNLKERIRTYSLTLIFLFLLYNSPSGLVLYWICNNLYSLFLNIANAAKKEASENKHIKVERSDIYSFVVTELILTILLGIVIPSAVIKSSPLEFVDINNIKSPLLFLLGSISISIGFFLLWIPFSYYVLDEARKKVYLTLVSFSYIALLDCFAFDKRLGYISSNLKYVDTPTFTLPELLINLLLVIFIIIACKFIYEHKKKIINVLSSSALVALLVISIINARSISYEYKNADFTETEDEEINIPLTSEGKNVVVFLLDKAMSNYVPYMLSEKPVLKDQFDGFTYYPNTISFGTITSQGAPPIYGGYDYIYEGEDGMPAEMRNQALELMPKMFSEDGYEVTIFDPPYANNQFIPDLSIYKDMDVRAFHAADRFTYTYDELEDSERRYRNFFCYSIYKSMPIVTKDIFYDNGCYNDVKLYVTDSLYSDPRKVSGLISKGVSCSSVFESNYAELCALSDITKKEDGDKNTFFMGYNLTPHEPTILKEPEYEPRLYVDNTEFDEKNKLRFTVDGKTMKVENATQMYHYQVNMATFIKLGEWFDYLRDNNLYDNTRIILVADHGWNLNQFENLTLENGHSIDQVNPLLMVKDFDAKGFTTDDKLMTNADVPALAMEGLIKDMTNPYTGNKIEIGNKSEYSISAIKAKVKNNIFDINNWEVLEK